MLINNAELYERRCQIENAPNVEAYSLMTKNRIVTSENGLEITLGHPSYAEQVRNITAYQSYARQMSDADRRRFEGMLRLLYMIRSIKLPNGVVTNNIYQNYHALMLLNQLDLDLVNTEVDAMRKKILSPRFGVKEAKCPHCGHVNKDVAYRNLLDLVFYHTTVSSLLTEKLVKKTVDEQENQ